MVKYSILEKEGFVSLKEEFLRRLELIREENPSIYSPFLNEDIVELYYNSVDNFLLHGLFDRYNALRERGFNRKKICEKIGIDYDESDYLLGDVDQDALLNECDSLDFLLNNEIFGVVNANGENKKRIRNLFPTFIEDHLLENTDQISYTGLENVNFRSYVTLARNLNQLSVDRSLIIEAGLRNFNIMNSIKQYAAIWGDEGSHLFDNLIIEKGLMSDVFQHMYSDTHRFNVVNLDFDGQFSPNKEYTIKLLFRNKLVDTPAMLFVTLNNNEHKKLWLKHWYDENADQHDLLDKTIRKYSENKSVELVYEEEYRYGVSDEKYKDGSKMLFFAYLIK
ncbi:hypothetical protein CL617_02330 [archaeon]|nr:hypothetical protein [archaeon]|tara:strand:+ start:11063 stop:12070 length:1008 start_codon:yes stop_codon:yes gene_type:complete